MITKLSLEISPFVILFFVSMFIIIMDLTKRITQAELGDQYEICDPIFRLTISCNPVGGV